MSAYGALREAMEKAHRDNALLREVLAAHRPELDRIAEAARQQRVESEIYDEFGGHAHGMAREIRRLRETLTNLQGKD